MAPSRNSGLQRLNERLALLRVGVDSMLRSSDLVALTIADAAHNDEFATGQKKTRKPAAIYPRRRAPFPQGKTLAPQVVRLCHVWAQRART
jgi:hypothetical protein